MYLSLQQKYRKSSVSNEKITLKAFFKNLSISTKKAFLHFSKLKSLAGNSFLQILRKIPTNYVVSFITLIEEFFVIAWIGCKNIRSKICTKYCGDNFGYCTKFNFALIWFSLFLTEYDVCCNWWYVYFVMYILTLCWGIKYSCFCISKYSR